MATEQTSISECCRSGTLHAGTPKGSTQTIGGRQCYVSSTSKGSKAKTVVIITDIFGLYNNMMFVVLIVDDANLTLTPLTGSSRTPGPKPATMCFYPIFSMVRALLAC